MEAAQITHRPCQLCNIKSISINSFQNHIEGKRHKDNLEKYERKHKTVYISGSKPFKDIDLIKIFKKFGEVTKVEKFDDKHFCFLQFKDESSVELACKARVFAGNLRLYVRRFKVNEPDESKCKQKKRKMTDSPPPLPIMKENTFGLQNLPIELPSPLECPEECNLFEWQIINFVSQVELTKESYEKIFELTNDVQEIFSPYFPGCQVLVFGSCGSTLAFKESDVDLFLQCDGDQPENFVKKEAKALYKSRKILVLQRVPGARVPIVKFEHKSSGFKCDITAKNKLGLCNTNLIRFLMEFDERLRPLMMLIKYWAKVCGISGESLNHQTFTCYSLIVLIIFYLQSINPPILPPIAILQKLAEPKDFSEGWECSFCNELWKIQEEYPMAKNKSSFKELLFGFFEFYYNYDFKNVICPLLGRSIPVSDFEYPEKLPEEMYVYKEGQKTKVNKTNPGKDIFKTNVMIKVQDPFELSINVTKNVTDNLYFIFKNALALSLELGKTTQDQSLLQALFSIDKSSLDPVKEILRVKINFNKKNGDINKDEDLETWHKLQIQSVLLVLEEILKFKVEQLDPKQLFNKIQKLETSQDVHTSETRIHSDNLVYNCTSDHDLWSSRNQTAKAIRKQLQEKKCNDTFLYFEKEFCISHSLYTNSNTSIPIFCFQLEICSIENIKASKNKFIQIVVKNNIEQKKNSDLKQAANFLKNNLRNFIMWAEEFITLKSKSTPLENVKNSLKDLLRHICSEQSNSNVPSEDQQVPKLAESNPNNNINEDKTLYNQNLLLINLEKPQRSEHIISKNSSSMQIYGNKSTNEPYSKSYSREFVGGESDYTVLVYKKDLKNFESNFIDTTFKLKEDEMTSKNMMGHIQSNKTHCFTSVETGPLLTNLVNLKMDVSPLHGDQTEYGFKKNVENKEKIENQCKLLKDLKTETQNIKTNSKGINTEELKSATDGHNMPQNTNCLKHSQNHYKQNCLSLKPSTPEANPFSYYPGFNTTRRYRSQPSANHGHPYSNSQYKPSSVNNPTDGKGRHNDNRTPVEKQRLWYPSLK